MGNCHVQFKGEGKEVILVEPGASLKAPSEGGHLTRHHHQFRWDFTQVFFAHHTYISF